MARFEEKWKTFDDKRRKAIEICVGVVLAVISAVLLVFVDLGGESTSFFDWSTVVAFLLVYAGPKVMEKQVAAPLPTLRKTMIGSMIGLVALLFIRALILMNSGA